MGRRIVPLIATLALFVLIYEALAAQTLEGLDLPPRYAFASLVAGIAAAWALVTLLRGKGGE